MANGNQNQQPTAGQPSAAEEAARKQLEREAAGIQQRAQQVEQAGLTGQELTQVGAEERAGATAPQAIQTVLGRRQEGPVVTSAAVREKADTAFQQAQDIQRQTAALAVAPRPTPVAPPAPALAVPEEPKLDINAQTGLTPTQEDLFSRFQQLNQETYNSTVQTIKAQVEKEKAAAEQAHKETVGASQVQLARMGALFTTSAGTQYLDDLEVEFRGKISDITARGNAAIEAAGRAKEAGNLEIMSQQLAKIRENRIEVQNMQQRQFDNLKKMQEIQQFQRENAAQTLDTMITAGINLEQMPDGYMDSLDRAMGYPLGVSEALWEVGQEQKRSLQIVAAQEANAVAIDQAVKLQTLLEKVPQGSPVIIDGQTYYGRNIGEITSYTEKLDDNSVFGVTFNKSTGEWGRTFLGKAPANSELIWDEVSGLPFWADKTTRTFQSAMNPQIQYPGVQQTDFAQLAINGQPLEEGSRLVGQTASGTNLGQCGAFVNTLMGTRFGDTLESKEALIDKTIGTNDNPLKVGDMFVQQLGSTGHVGIVNGIFQDPDGNTMIRVTESNYNHDERIGHSRTMKINDPNISGFVRGKLPAGIGTDAPKGPVNLPMIPRKLTLAEKNAEKKRVSSFAAAETLTPDQLANAIEKGYTTDKNLELFRTFTEAGREAPNLKKPTAAQSQAAVFAARIDQANDTLGNLEKEFSSSFSKLSLEGLPVIGGLAGAVQQRFLISEDRKLFEQSERNFINAVLRRESGAAIADSEFAEARQQYIPQPGDTEKVLTAKKSTRNLIFQGLQAEAGAAKLKIADETVVMTSPDGISYRFQANDPEIQQAIDAGWLPQ